MVVCKNLEMPHAIAKLNDRTDQHLSIIRARDLALVAHQLVNQQLR